MRLKLIPVRVVEELQTVLGKNCTRSVEDFNRATAFLFVEGVGVCDPGTAGVCNAERFCFVRNPFRIVPETLVCEVTADRLKPMSREHFLELRWRKFVGA